LNVKSMAIRVLLTNFGFGGSDQGGEALASTLRDAGMDVVYTGNYCTPEEIVRAAIQEDVNAIGVNLISDTNMSKFFSIIKLLKEGDASDIKVFFSGAMNYEDVEDIKNQGVSEVLLKDAPSDEIVYKLLKTVLHLRSREA
jgi:methylmalonyl-CoA mutase C-terminal domain/subunit